jgi:hypothetical protein
MSCSLLQSTAHPYNSWTASPIWPSQQLNVDQIQDKQLTAGRLIQAIEDDPYDLEIPTEPPKTDMYSGSCFSDRKSI